MSNAQQLSQIKTFHRERKISLDDFLAECEARAIEREKLIEKNGAAERFCDCAVRYEFRSFPTVFAIVMWWAWQPLSVQQQFKQLRGRIVSLGDTKPYKWTAEFVRQMDRLAKPLLRQSGNGADSLS